MRAGRIIRTRSACPRAEAGFRGVIADNADGSTIAAMSRTFPPVSLLGAPTDVGAGHRGAGKDVQKAGEKVEEKAEDCKDAEC